MATSPTQRTLALLRSEGYALVQVVERWNPHARKRIDLFGWIDVLALHPDLPGLYGIQATSRSNVSSRIRKMQDIESFKLWIENGNRGAVWGWSKRPKKKGSKQLTWQVRKVEDKEILSYGSK